jgi:hypothetical protein
MTATNDITIIYQKNRKKTKDNRDVSWWGRKKSTGNQNMGTWLFHGRAMMNPPCISEQGIRKTGDTTILD